MSERTYDPAELSSGSGSGGSGSGSGAQWAGAREGGGGGGGGGGGTVCGNGGPTRPGPILACGLGGCGPTRHELTAACAIYSRVHPNRRGTRQGFAVTGARPAQGRRGSFLAAQRSAPAPTPPQPRGSPRAVARPGAAAGRRRRWGV